MKKPKLYLIPNTLGDNELPSNDMGDAVKGAIEELSYFAVENL